MKRRNLSIIGIGIIIVVIFVLLENSPLDEDSEIVFHITLADPDLYSHGIYSETFVLPEGDFMFRFVPNGDSPKNLRIIIDGQSLLINENFELKGTPHNTGISEYFTWEYLGNLRFSNSDEQSVEIRIDPFQNILGPVTVDIIEI